MRLAIPAAPRRVTLSQVPGALRRVGLVAAAALAVTALLWLGGWLAGRALSRERDFLAGAVEVKGQVLEARLPPLERRERDSATVTVLYRYEQREYSTPVEMDAVRAEPLWRGAPLTVLVDPAAPARAREASFARSRAGLWWAAGAGVGLGLVLSGLAVAWELRRTLRRELQPLRTGMLVWLTPDGALPETRQEVVFPASYWKQDVQFRVKARARPGRAPVRNGDKVLAAVIEAEPEWVRVVDEDLARTLGWYQ